MKAKLILFVACLLVLFISSFAYAGGQPDTLKILVGGDKQKEVCRFWKGLDLKSEKADSLYSAVIAQSCNTEFDLETLEGHSLDEILYLLSFTERGREFLKTFFSLYDAKKLDVLNMNSTEAQVLPDKRPEGVYAEGDMFVDYENPMACLLPNFFHMGILALDYVDTPFDTELPKLGDYCEELRVTPKSDPGWQELAEKIVTLTFKSLNAQAKAYKATDVLISQLIGISPEFGEAIVIMVSNNSWIYPMTEQAFRDNMINKRKYDKNVVDSYLKKNPW